ncbi:NAD(P)-dependent oxidoreductase [Nitratireductor pacificus]|uniref:NAD-binding protein 6-phosphogluconate dehydrogenase n=1 Tax=Nitratireductor pacificus pht-3B TaxID=391937 RepID=K2MJQ4_9HYPH|nr:NAD(P)-binding domain-containing protein [Nitratireductor pacificus]EKF17412.1 NAD-binding protein 6-phosphogluconate dehydrogenase [Nitratireductor pacificus pht-3B]
MTTTICVIGAGRMGSSLARTLLNAGRPTWVWNRTAARCAPLVALGAKTANALADAVQASELILINVIDHDASAALLRQEAVSSALSGRTVIQLTSGSARLAREEALWVEAQGARYLDGAIMATPDFIGRPEAALLYSGSLASFEAHRDILLTLGGRSAHVGDVPGQASALDTALLTQMWGGLFGALQGMAVADAEGLSLDVFRDQLSAFKPVVDAALYDTIDRTAARRFAGDAETLASLGAHHSAFTHLLEACEDQGLDQGLPREMARLFREGLSRNGPEADFASLAPLLRGGPSSEAGEVRPDA